MGKNQLRMLKFSIEYPGWHSCGKDSRDTMYRLQAMGLFEVRSGKPDGHTYPQFRIAIPAWAHNGIDAARKPKD